MGLLQDATVEQSAAKIGIFGPQGSGKTLTSALILIGLSKTYHGGAPVAMMDTENGSDYLVSVFAAEGVPFKRFKSKAFSDMKDTLREAQQLGCCGYLVDSYTHPWTELQETVKAKFKTTRLQFHHMQDLKTMWGVWTAQMLNSPLHIILAGRLGWNWDRTEPDEGQKEGDLVKLGSKMKGESEAGYEPSLLIELEAVSTVALRDRWSHAKKSSIEHVAYVLKDRWRVLNGRTIRWTDINQYKPGGWQKTYKEFAPHFSQLAIGSTQKAEDATRTSERELGPATGGGDWTKRRAIAAEEIQGLLAAIWPGRDDTSKIARQTVLKHEFGTYSWEKVVNSRVEQLELSVQTLERFKARILGAEPDFLNTATRAETEMLIGKLLDEAAREADPAGAEHEPARQEVVL